jgi:hypothetical protein
MNNARRVQGQTQPALTVASPIFKIQVNFDFVVSKYISFPSSDVVVVVGGGAISYLYDVQTLYMR